MWPTFAQDFSTPTDTGSWAVASTLKRRSFPSGEFRPGNGLRMMPPRHRHEAAGNEPMREEKKMNGERLLEGTETSANPEEETASGGTGVARPEGAAQAAEAPRDPAAAYQKAVAEKQELYDRLLRKQAE